MGATVDPTRGRVHGPSTPIRNPDVRALTALGNTWPLATVAIGSPQSESGLWRPRRAPSRGRCDVHSASGGYLGVGNARADSVCRIYDGFSDRCHRAAYERVGGAPTDTRCGTHNHISLRRVGAADVRISHRRRFHWAATMESVRTDAPSGPRLPCTHPCWVPYALACGVPGACKKPFPIVPAHRSGIFF